MEKLLNMIAALAAELQKPVGDRDEKNLQTLSAKMAAEVEEAKSAGYVSTEQFDEVRDLVGQLRTDIDAAVDTQRNMRRVQVASAVSMDVPARRFDRRIMRFSSDDLAINFAKFCVKIRRGDVRGMTPSTGPEGGWLTPEPQMASEVFRMTESVGVAERLGRPIPLGRGGFSIARGLTGATVYFKAAGGTVTESTPTVGLLTMKPETLMALIDVDVELEEDVMIQLGNFLASEFAYGMALKTDHIAFQGDGSPGDGGVVGILESDCVTQVDMAATKDAFEDITFADLTSLEAAVVEEALDNARWLFHRSVKKHVKDVTDTGGKPIWQPAGGGEPATIFGYEHTVASQMPTNAASAQTTPFMGFGDFYRGLYVGSAGGLVIGFDDSVGFKNLQRCFRAYRRLDVAVNGYNATELAANTQLANPLARLATGATGG